MLRVAEEYARTGKHAVPDEEWIGEAYIRNLPADDRTMETVARAAVDQYQNYAPQHFDLFAAIGDVPKPVWVVATVLAAGFYNPRAFGAVMWPLAIIGHEVIRTISRLLFRY